jgi:phage-related tail fiber protein
VLVKDQTTGSANGIYLAASGAWTRSLDADINAEVTAGLSVMVTEGTTLADTQWRLTTNDAVVVGTTALVFAQIGAGSSYTSGTGINVAGNVINIDTAVTVRKFAQTVGDGSAVSIAVTHGLNTLDVQVQVYELATGATVECDVTRNSVNQVTVGFTTAPASNTLRVLVQG